MIMSPLPSTEFFVAGHCCEFFHPGFCKPLLDFIDVGKTWRTSLQSTLVMFSILMAQRSVVSTTQETSFQSILMTAVCPRVMISSIYFNLMSRQLDPLCQVSRNDLP
jgi:hypothetical protein